MKLHVVLMLLALAGAALVGLAFAQTHGISPTQMIVFITQKTITTIAPVPYTPPTAVTINGILTTVPQFSSTINQTVSPTTVTATNATGNGGSGYGGAGSNTALYIGIVIVVIIILVAAWMMMNKKGKK